MHKGNLNIRLNYLSRRKKNIVSQFSDWWKIICDIARFRTLAKTLDKNDTKNKGYSKVILLEIKIDQNLNLKLLIENIFRIAKYNVYTLRKIWWYLTVEKTKLLLNTFFNRKFYYLLMLRMFCWRTLISKKRKEIL